MMAKEEGVGEDVSVSIVDKKHTIEVLKLLRRRFLNGA